MNPNQPIPPNKHQLTLKLDFRIISLLLLAVIGALLFVWKPWQANPSARDRTVQVTGEARVTAEPDEFVFTPSYQFKNTDKAAALAELGKKSDQIVSELKKIGVPDNKIKSNADGYERGIYMPEAGDGSSLYNLSLTVTVTNRDLAQKVQDYLVSTSPTGAVSAQPNFSDEKRRQLESQARQAAAKDARKKAEQSAENIGYKIGKVKSVSDGSGFGPIMPLDTLETSVDSSASTRLALQPGENELNYSVTVVYYIR